MQEDDPIFDGTERLRYKSVADAILKRLQLRCGSSQVVLKGKILHSKACIFNLCRSHLCSVLNDYSNPGFE
jgi:hypothetical protein